MFFAAFLHFLCFKCTKERRYLLPVQMKWPLHTCFSLLVYQDITEIHFICEGIWHRKGGMENLKQQCASMGRKESQWWGKEHSWGKQQCQMWHANKLAAQGMGAGYLGRWRNGQREAAMAGKGHWWRPREVVDQCNTVLKTGCSFCSWEVHCSDS